MKNDVIITIGLASQTPAVTSRGILILANDGEKPYKEYGDLAAVALDWPASTKAYAMAKALFDQVDGDGQRAVGKVSVVGIGASASIGEALEAIRAEHDDWYYLLCTDNTEETVTALASWADTTEPDQEDQRGGKLYVGRTADEQLVLTGGRTALIYAGDGEAKDAAWIGAVVQHYPQSVTWKFKRLTDVTPSALTADELEALAENHINAYVNRYKQTYTIEGVCTDGEYIDVIVGKDAIADDMRAEIVGLYVDNPTLPYDSTGFGLVGAAVIRVLDRYVGYGVIATDANGAGIYSVSIPDRADASEQQAVDRQMPAIRWTAQLRGSIHQTVIGGTLRVTA